MSIPENRKWEIYTLGTESQGVRYVGVTVQSTKRFTAHLYRAKRGENTHKDRWLRSLRSSGEAPLFTVIQEGLGEDWQAAEKNWIQFFRGMGCDLTNLTAGGEGCLGYVHSNEVREAQSARTLGKKLSPEHRLAISKALLGRGKTEAHKARMRGRKATPEALRNMSAAHKGHTVSPETRAKISASKLGRPVSGAARVGLKLSDKHRAAISSGLKGKKYPPERSVAIWKTRRAAMALRECSQ